MLLGYDRPPDPVCLPPYRSVMLATAVLASSMGFIDSSVTALIVPAIRATLGATLSQAQWISGAYLLALSAVILIGGALADRFGIVRVFAGGIGFFVLGSLLCAAALTPGQLIAARGFQGCAAGIMVPGSMALVARAYPKSERGRALGLWAAATTATTALGAVLGGAMLDFGSAQIWRAIFALNLPLGLVALVLLRRHATVDFGRPGAPIDWTGAALATIGLGLMAFGLTSPGAASLPLAAAGMALFAGFLVWERRCPHPMIRLGMFKNRSFSAANLATFLLYLAITGIGFYLPMTAMTGWGRSPVEVTLGLLPIPIQIAVLSAPIGRLADRIGPFRPMAAGALIVAVAYAGFAMVALKADFWWQVVPLSILSGFGIALVVAPLTIAVMAEATEAEQGAASGINNVVARTATLFAVALLGRVATLAYGDVGTELPGFGLTATAPGHVTATGRAFAWMAGLAAVCALASALVCAARIKHRPS